MNTGSILPEHITRITRTVGGCWNLPIPAESAPPYEHQLQQNITIFGCHSSLVVAVAVVSAIFHSPPYRKTFLTCAST
jgi:hypothetical protein